MLIRRHALGQNLLTVLLGDTMKQAARSQSRPGGEVGLEAGCGTTPSLQKHPSAPLSTPWHPSAPLVPPRHPSAMGPSLHAHGISCCLPPGPRSPQQHVALCVRLGTPSGGPGRPRVRQSYAEFRLHFYYFSAAFICYNLLSRPTPAGCF